MDPSWDASADLLVVGSGGGGMTAAIVAADRGLDVLVIEKGKVYGGSTAMSGGALWIPNNHLMQRSGLVDSPEDSMSYLKTLTAGRVPDDRLLAYNEAAPKLLSHLEQRTDVRFRIVPGYSDYYPRVGGARPGGGRTVEPVPFNALRLGSLRHQMRPLPRQARLLGRLMATAYDAHMMLDTSLRGRLWAVRVFGSYLVNPFRFLAKTDTRLTLGNALIGRLRLSMKKRSISLWLNTPAIRLIMENGRVAGIEAKREGKTVSIRADRGVLLAAGGFPHNRAMRQRYEPAELSKALSMACPDNQGDAVQMGIEAGAALDLMDEAWWMPVSMVPGDTVPQMILIERSLPGCIMVNKEGRRFTNEAAPYIDVVKDQYANNLETGAAIPAYMIMDSRFRSKYPTSPMLPGFTPSKYIENGYMKKAGTLEDLARQCGIDIRGLSTAMERFNTYAATGRDPDFDRGSTPIDRFYGDAAVKPNPCLAPIDRPPYYAIEIWPGDLGTKGGLVTDRHARVLQQDGSPIQGLYATGNCTASVMGTSYAGAGATVGPAMVFGYLAALHAVS